MVFFYQIRGGPCQGELADLTLRSQDICCYVGRDKYENESLIQYGWPGDIWFHVDGYSSAHVYFRLKYEEAAAYHNQQQHQGDNMIPLDGVIPMDCLPEASIEDMMQIVKHNSIEGSKLSSCKIVWTPHSNLKKQFDMADGSVTYHNTKICRYGRCHKDRARIKALEKTKSHDYTDIDFFAEMKANERALIERRKQVQKYRQRKGASTEDTFDPIAADRNNTALKLSRQGDDQSGIDQGLKSLEGLNLGHQTDHTSMMAAGSGVPTLMRDENDNEMLPLWIQQQQQNERDYSNNETAIFLLERGYPKEKVDSLFANGSKPISNIHALKKLWGDIGAYASATNVQVDKDEIATARQEEREVLDAIFGEEADWFASTDAHEMSSLDVSVPITSYDPPSRYYTDNDEPPPELRLEIYLKDTVYPFERDLPVLALVGGGIPLDYLYKMTKQLYEEAAAKAQEEEPGDPQLFALVTHVGDIWEAVVEEEGVAFERANEEARKAKAKAKSEVSEKKSSVTSETVPQKFLSEQDRRAYAVSVVSKGALATTKESTSTTKGGKGRKYYKVGVSDQDLVREMFG